MSSSGPQIYGSGKFADVFVAGDGVAERHCQIVFDVDGYWLEDLLSGSGTFVNGDSVSSRLLREGDLIHLGAAAFVFSDGRLVRHLKAYVEQPIRMPEVPSLPDSTYDLPDDLPLVATPGSTGQVRAAGPMSKPLRVALVALVVVIGALTTEPLFDGSGPGGPHGPKLAAVGEGSFIHFIRILLDESK